MGKALLNTGQPSGRIKMKETDIAYLAGIIDSDGCISISKYSNCRAYRMLITVVQRDMELIEYLYSIFGGSVNVVSTKHGNAKDFYLRWVVTDNTGMKLLRLVMPYLKLKKQQALLAMELYSIKENCRKLSGRYTDESITKQQSLFFEIKKLNSPATTESFGSLTREMRQSELAEMKNRQSAFRSEAPLGE